MTQDDRDNPINIASKWLKDNTEAWFGPAKSWTPEQRDHYCRDLGLLVVFVSECWPAK